MTGNVGLRTGPRSQMVLPITHPTRRLAPTVRASPEDFEPSLISFLKAMRCRIVIEAKLSRLRRAQSHHFEHRRIAFDNEAGRHIGALFVDELNL